MKQASLLVLAAILAVAYGSCGFQNSMCNLCYPNCKNWCLKWSLCCHTISSPCSFYSGHNYPFHFGEGYGFDLVPRKPTGFECPAEGVRFCPRRPMIQYKECSTDDECIVQNRTIPRRMCCMDSCFQRNICVNAVPIFAEP